MFTIPHVSIASLLSFHELCLNIVAGFHFIILILRQPGFTSMIRSRRSDQYADIRTYVWPSASCSISSMTIYLSDYDFFLVDVVHVVQQPEVSIRKSSDIIIFAPPNQTLITLIRFDTGPQEYSP